MSDGVNLERSKSRRGLVEVPDLVWAPLAVGGQLLAVGLIALAAGEPWLFPSLGPTVYLQAEEPSGSSSRFYNTTVGHLIGFVAGLVAVLALGASSSPSVLASKEITLDRVAAAAIAGALTMLGLALLKASHPPAAATTLLVALGGISPTWRGAGMIAAGVLVVAVLGLALRYLRLVVFPPPAPGVDVPQ